MIDRADTHRRTMQMAGIKIWLVAHLDTKERVPEYLLPSFNDVQIKWSGVEKRDTLSDI